MPLRRPPFMERCPALHLLNGRLHSQFACASNRSRFMGWLTDYAADSEAWCEREKEREEQLIAYFTEEVFKPGNERLRDETVEVEGCRWRWFESWAYWPSLDAHYPNGIPIYLREGTYYVPGGDLESAKRRRASCFNQRTNALSFGAWCPLELNDPDPNIRPQPPLPPTNIGRPYTLPEIAWGLAVIHDADGGYEPFVADVHELRTLEWDVAISRVSDACCPQSAQDAWLTSLEPLFARLLREPDVHAGVLHQTVSGTGGNSSDEVKLLERLDDTPKEFRDGGLESGEPLTSAITKMPEKYNLSPQYLSKKYKGPRLKVGKRFIYRHAEIAALADSKTARKKLD